MTQCKCVQIFQTSMNAYEIMVIVMIMQLVQILMDQGYANVNLGFKGMEYPRVMVGSN